MPVESEAEFSAARVCSIPDGVGWYTHRNRIASTKVNNFEVLADCDDNMHKVAELSLGNHQHAGIVVLGIAYKRLQKRSLE